IIGDSRGVEMSLADLCSGYFVSGLICTEDWHAGVRMVDRYHRFLRFFSDGWWLWTDRDSRDGFDFRAFVAALDFTSIRATVPRPSPPTSPERDGGHLYEIGSYVLEEDRVRMTIHSAIAEWDFDFEVHFGKTGNELLGFSSRFEFIADDREANKG